MVCGSCIGELCPICLGKKFVYTLIESLEPLAEEDKPKEPCTWCSATGRIKHHDECIEKNGKDSTHCDCQHREDPPKSAVLHAV
jgi:hypothetical protein